MSIRTHKLGLALISAALTLLAASAFAQAPAPAHKPNLIQRHPTLTALAAGEATHHTLKVSARNAKMHGQKLNFAQRHPTMSALGAGVLTHHEIKAHTAH